MENWIDPIIEFLLLSSAFLLMLGIVSLFVIHILRIRGRAKLWICSILIIMPLVYPIGALLPNHLKISIPLERLHPFYYQVIEHWNAAIPEYIISLIESDKSYLHKVVFTETQISDPKTIDPAISMSWSKPASFFSLNLKMIIATTWIVLSVLIMVRLLFMVKRIRLLIKCADPVIDPYILALLKQCSDETGLRRIPRLLIVDRMMIPMAVGLLYPTIVVPKKLLEPKFKEGLRFTLLHELKHLKRNDNWWLLFESLVSAVYFFHPIIYWAKQKIHEEWEYICDRHVIKITKRSASYADFLLHEIWEHGREANPSLAVPFILNTHKAAKRVYSILEKRRPSLYTKIRDRFAVSIFFVCFISLFLCSVTPSAHIKEDDLKKNKIQTSDDPGGFYVSAIKDPIEQSKEDLSSNTLIIEKKPLGEQKSEEVADVVQNSMPADPEPAAVTHVPESIETENEYELKTTLEDEEGDSSESLKMAFNEIDSPNDAEIPAVSKMKDAGVDEMGTRLIDSEIAMKNNEIDSRQYIDLASLNMAEGKESLNPGNSYDSDETVDAVKNKEEELNKEDTPANMEQTERSSENVRIPKGARIFQWQAIDDRNIIIMTYFYGNFKATLEENGPEFSVEEIIGVEAQWPYELDEHSSILLSNGDKCRIEKLVPYTKKGVSWRWNIF